MHSSKDAGTILNYLYLILRPTTIRLKIKVSAFARILVMLVDKFRKLTTKIPLLKR